MKRYAKLVAGIAAGFLLIFGTGVNAATESEKKVKMQRHIDKVKRSNPKKYDEMVKAAGGNVTDCLSCHHDIFQSKEKPGQGR